MKLCFFCTASVEYVLQIMDFTCCLQKNVFISTEAMRLCTVWTVTSFMQNYIEYEYCITVEAEALSFSLQLKYVSLRLFT